MDVAKLALFAGAGLPLEFVEHPLPSALGPGEILVEILLATICGSDLHTFDGRRQEPVPAVLGHEAVGRVVACGANRTEVLPGDRVTWTLADSCGACSPCVEWQLPQKCSRLFKYGHASIHDGTGLNGCYASHLILRGGTTVFRVPDSLPDQWVAPANCALATMVCATETLPTPCGVAVIQGAGLLGLYGCALLRSRRVERVLVVDTLASRLKRVAAFGGEPVLNSLEGVVPQDLVDAIFEVAGTSEVIPEGIRFLRPGGLYTFVGMVHPGTPLTVTGEMVVRKCLTFRGFHNYAPRHLERALAFLERQRDQYPWAELVSPPFALCDLQNALEETRNRVWPRVSIRP